MRAVRLEVLQHTSWSTLPLFNSRCCCSNRLFSVGEIPRYDCCCPRDLLMPALPGAVGATGATGPDDAAGAVAVGEAENPEELLSVLALASTFFTYVAGTNPSLPSMVLTCHQSVAVPSTSEYLSPTTRSRFFASDGSEKSYSASTYIIARMCRRKPSDGNTRQEKKEKGGRVVDEQQSLTR